MRSEPTSFGQTKVLEKVDIFDYMKAFIIFFCFVMYQSAVSKHYLVKTKDSGSPWQGRGGGYGGRRGSGYNYNKPANIAGNDYSNDYQGEDYPDVGRLPDTPLLPGGDSLLPPDYPPTEQTTTRDKFDLLDAVDVAAVLIGKKRF